MLFENNNKTMINRVAKKSFKANRVRNVVAVTAIALTAFLFTSVFTMGMGAGDSIKMSMAKQVGSQADVSVSHLNKKQFEGLKENSQIEKIGCWIPIGIMTNTHRLNTEVDYADAAARELQFLTPGQGEAPQGPNEVLVSSNILKDMGIEEKTGVEIPVEFTLRGVEYHFDMKVSGIYTAGDPQKGFVIVSEAFLQEHSDVIVNTYTKDRNLSGTYTAGIIMKEKAGITDRLAPVIRELGGNTEDKEAENYVRIAESPVSKSADSSSFLLAVFVFGILFVLCGYLLIYNVFDISVTNEIRQYGLLRTIGTTTKQMKRLVNRQAMLLSVIGIPIGLVLGIAAGRLLLPFAMQMFTRDYGVDSLTIASLPYLAIAAGSGAFTALTVYISTRRPVRKAARVSAMEAVRYVDQERISIKGKMRPATGAWQMASKNLKRNRRRTALIITSLMLSVILMNSVIVLADSVDEDIYVNRSMSSDFWVSNTDTALQWKGYRDHNSGLSEEIAGKLEERPEVKNGARLYRNTFDDDNISCYWGMDFPELDHLKPEVLGLPDKFHISGNAEKTADAVLTKDLLPLGLVYGMEENLLERMEIIEGEKDKEVLKEKLNSGKYVIIAAKYNDKGVISSVGEKRYYDLEVGDPIQFYEDGVLIDTFTVLAKVGVTTELIEAVSHSNIAASIGSPYIYLSAEHFKEIYKTPTLLSYSFDTAPKDQEKMERYLTDLINHNPDVTYSSTKSLLHEIQSLKNTFLLVGGLIGIIFAFVGILNFVNVTITSIITRRHEFATMQSIGMTHKQLCRLVTMECLSYVGRAAVIGTILAGVLGMTLIKMVVEKGSFWFMTFHMTLVPALLFFLIFAILALIVPNIALKVFNRGSVIERLRVTE